MAATKSAFPIGYAAGGLLLGYGVYYGTQKKEIMKLEKEADDCAKFVQNEKKALTLNENSVEENEARLQSLVKQAQVLKIESSQTEAKLEAARQEVVRLEKEASRARDAIAKNLSETNETSSRLSKLQSEYSRIKESLSLGEKSLELARQKAVQAQDLLNPFNHPAVQKLRSK